LLINSEIISEVLLYVGPRGNSKSIYLLSFKVNIWSSFNN